MRQDETLSLLKNSIRRSVRAARKALSDSERADKSRLIGQHLAAAPFYREAAAVMAYAGYGSEVATEAIIRTALADHKDVSLPRVEGDTMHFIRIRAMDDLIEGYHGILEPRGLEIFDPLATEGLVLLLMPGLAFDRNCHRLGQGGGFYDRYLAELARHCGDPGESFSKESTDRSRDIVTCALAFNCQLVAEVPAEAHDQRPDFILTETELIGDRHDI
ncbi:MAG: 5-formyltetrahydrofolate cyclo-ligase [Lachnospiraceae bacterium]|nr:5-formyltetrahydrofolate cyclo-ligase [Lachnospiraceae bacterium]